MSFEEIQNLIALMKASGVRRFKSADVELELSPDVSIAPVAPAVESTEPSPEPSYEETLFWSVPGALTSDSPVTANEDVPSDPSP